MREKLVRWSVYIGGLILLALGITLNTKTGLGVSPMVSVPYVAAVLGGWSLGNATLVSYIVFMVIQMILKGRKYRAWDLLQFPFSIAFTRFMNLFENIVPVQTRLPNQLGLLAAAFVLTGMGAAMSLDMRLVPNPSDGVVQAVSDRVHREVGLCKNFVDGFMVAVAVAMGLIFRGRIIGIGIGTVAAVLCIGRIIALFNRLCLERLKKAAGL